MWTAIQGLKSGEFYSLQEIACGNNNIYGFIATIYTTFVFVIEAGNFYYVHFCNHFGVITVTVVSELIVNRPSNKTKYTFTFQKGKAKI